jgi:hypothetical protein
MISIPNPAARGFGSPVPNRVDVRVRCPNNMLSMTPTALEDRLRAVRPALLVVADRHLARLLRRRIDTGVPTATAHDIPYRLTRAELLDDDVLAGRVESLPDGDVLVVAEPDDLRVERLPEPLLLREYWKILFFDAVEAAVRDTVPGPGDGPTIDEARFVLEQDHRIAEGASDAEVWRRLIAHVATRAMFEPETVGEFFPAVGAAGTGPALWPASLDLAGPLAATRPEGAAGPSRPSPPAAPETVAPPLDVPATGTTTNVARAAIERFRAGDRIGAGAAVARLVAGLAPRLNWDASRARDWATALWPLLPVASSGRWPHAARLLYDLQTIAHDLSGDVYAVDLPGAIRSFGQRPVRRKLLYAPDVFLLRTLASVRRHLDASHLSDADDRRLASLVDADFDRVEATVRGRVGPVIARCLADAGFVPASTVERVAKDALIAELLDKICDRGFVRFGDLRDAVAKHGPKMADLAGAGEWFRGDALLRADRLLADALDGVYHRGEVYLRTFQRLSSLGFGNRVGRAATLYLILPFLGAFLTLEFAQHVVHGSMGAYGYVSKILAPKKFPPPEHAVTPAPIPVPEPDPEFFDPWDEPVTIDPAGAAEVFKQVVTTTAGGRHGGPHLVTGPAVLVVGLLILGLLHVPAFRRFVWEGAKRLGRAVVWVAYDVPNAIWAWPPFRQFRNHPVSRFLYRRFSTAAAITLVLIVTMWFLGATPGRILKWTLYSFTAVSLFAYTPFGRRFEDDTAGAMADAWKLIRVNLIPGVVAWCLWVFRELVGLVERALYAVDEWFRFREGQQKPNVALKAVLGLLWFPVAYAVRFGFNLLLEPQVNPIKHFPVVTVSHKVLFTTIPWFCETFGLSEATVVAIIWCIPGIFGFLAWEFKENWRLYRATVPKTLRPLAIGHHGETVRGLLRPGFHSGTVPKHFRALRRRIRAAERAGGPPDRHPAAHERHHIAIAVARLVDRQVLALVRTTPAWQGRVLAVTRVTMTVRTLAVTLEVGGPGPVVVTWAFDGEHVRQAVEGIPDTITAEQRTILARGFGGLAALAAANGDVDRDNWVKAWGT